MNKKILTEYARLIAETGANIQPGQQAVITASLDQPDFVELLARQCYLAGASKVTVEWTHLPITRLAAEYETGETLSRVEKWETEKLSHRADILPAMIYLESDDPNGLSGIDQEKYSAAVRQRRKVFKPYRDRMENKYQWCIAAVPGRAWAKKVFPDLSGDEAVEKLWKMIIYTSRAQGDAIENWRRHNADSHKICDYLNSLDITELHYTASNGTDLTVGMIDKAQFMGASDKTLSGTEFNANIPTEEIFISPDRSRADGIVYASMPLSYQGQLIESFWVRFEDGRAVEVHAEKNEALLRSIIEMDPGACHLGECALVPFDSPIRNTGILFYNTLFDENAACHLALGEGFSFCIGDCADYTLEQCRDMGINESIVHVDFMIGTDDLNITAKTGAGETVQIFRDGNWAQSLTEKTNRE